MASVLAALEADFAAFRRSGDPAALARVFDVAAPRLLLLAAHWTRDPAAAEDLVQVTFIQAARDCAQWRDDQPLLRWLGGILAHRALDRRRGTSPTVPLDDQLAATAAAPTPSPLQAAIDGETMDRCCRALERLESPYREVLTLRIVHGLEPTAIAHALARAPATVRKQLERGLRQLRSIVEPALAGALAIALLPRRGLAAVRGEVLAAAGAAKVAATTVLAGGLLVKKLALCVVVVVGVILAWPHAAAAPTIPAGAAATTTAPLAVADANAATTTANGTAAGAAGERSTAGAAAGAIEVAAVCDDDNTPLPDIAIELAARDGSDEQLGRRSAATDAAGRVAFTQLAPCVYEVTTGALGATAAARRVEVAAGERAAVELRLPRGNDVRGTVVTADDVPIAGATVRWRANDGERGRSTAYRCAVTAADGTFAVRVAAATVALDATHADHANSPLVTIDARRPPASLRLRLRRAPAALHGTVHLDGAPVADACIELRPADDAERIAEGILVADGASSFARSDGDGAFAFAGLPAGDATVLIRAHGAEPFSTTVTLAAATPTALAFELRRGPTIRGCVRDSDGKPLADAAIACAAAQTRTGGDGNFALDCLAPGPQTLLAYGLRHHAGARRELTLAAGTVTVCDFVLERLPELAGRVVDLVGRGLPHMIVTAYRRDQGADTFEPVVDAAGRFDDEHDRRATTDSDGAFAVPVMPEVDYQLQIREAGQWLAAADGADYGTFRAPAADLVLTLRPEQLATAFVAGRVLGADGRPVTGAWLQIADGTRIGTVGNNTPGTAVGTDGRFTVGPVPARRYSLRVRPFDAREAPLDTAKFDLAPAATLDLGDISAGRPATLAIALRRRGGGTFRRALLQAVGNDGEERVWTFDPEGRITQALAAGSYDLTVYGDEFPSREQHLQLAAGELRDLEIELAAGVRFPVTVRLPDGEASATMTIRGPDGTAEFDAECAAADATTLAWVPTLTPGPHTAELRCAGEHRYAGSFVVGTDSNAATAPLVIAWTPAR